MRRIPADVRECQINELPNITFVRWDGEYRNCKSKAICRCDIDGFEWSARVGHLIDSDRGCPQCAGLRRWTADERVEQIDNLQGVTFVRWDDEYRNNKSKCVCRCDEGHEWKTSVAHLVSNGRRCPHCALRKTSERFRMPESKRIAQINSIEGVSFVRWDGEYRNNKSRCVCRCDKGHEWTAVINSIVDTGRRCPQCASSGYDRTKPATLYALRSECGTMVKIGISNNTEQRHAILKRKTPFAFECVEMCHGDGATVATLEKVLHGLTEPVVFDTPFDGSTEWRKWDARLPEWFDLYRSWS